LVYSNSIENILRAIEQIGKALKTLPKVNKK